MPEALGAVFPATTLQTCIVHLIRNSLDYASWKDRKLLAAAIKPIYTAPSAEAAQAELDAFEQGPWGRKFPTVVAAWRRAWDRVIPFFAFPPAVRKGCATVPSRSAGVSTNTFSLAGYSATPTAGRVSNGQSRCDTTETKRNGPSTCCVGLSAVR